MLDTRTFLDTLSTHPGALLAFSHADFQVPGGFHLTEVKALAIEGMDCGGHADQWFETHFQLWHSGKEDHHHLDVGRFLRIVDRVRPAVPLRDTAQARIEWGDGTRPAVLYPVGGATYADGTLTVQLYDPRVTCKANDRLSTALPVVVGAGCAPGSGCC